MIDLLTQLDWRAPWAWLLALQPALIWAIGRRRQLRLAEYADTHLLPWAVTGARRAALSNASALLHRLGVTLAWLLLAAAAAGPRLPLPDVGSESSPAQQRHALDVELVLDVSASMNAADIAPTRRERAQLEINDWLRRLRGERVGIIVYAGDAGILLPPTDDVALLQRALTQARGELIQQPGSHVAAALDLAAQQLRGKHGKAILLVTDADAASLAGADGEAARVAAQGLRRDGIPLYVLGVGSAVGAPIPLSDGDFAEQDGVQVISRMHATGYDDLARASGGRFSRVTDGDADWNTLHDHGIARLPGDPVAPEQVQAWNELYAWCLAPALALLMLTGIRFPSVRRTGREHA